MTAVGPATFTTLVPPPADGSTHGRLGRLEVGHGTIETPQFMPVGTNATVKALHPDDIAEVGATIILANTYHLYLRPGHERIERLGGLHRFMAWNGPILTDGGRAHLRKHGYDVPPPRRPEQDMPALWDNAALVAEDGASKASGTDAASVPAGDPADGGDPA